MKHGCGGGGGGNGVSGVSRSVWEIHLPQTLNEEEMCIRDSIRTFLKKKLYSAGVSKIEIERASDRVKVIIYTAKPGVVIGKGGSEIEKVKAELQNYTSKKLIVDIKEVKRPDKDAQLVAENIALQLENRISFRRAMKSTMPVSYTHLDVYKRQMPTLSTLLSFAVLWMRTRYPSRQQNWARWTQAEAAPLPTFWPIIIWKSLTAACLY